MAVSCCERSKLVGGWSAEVVLMCRIGQIVMEGFLKIRLKPWLRRIMTRMVAIVPAAVVAGAVHKHPA